MTTETMTEILEQALEPFCVHQGRRLFEIENHGTNSDLDKLSKSLLGTLFEWQPIETAPKDGTFIYLLGDSGYISYPVRIRIGRWLEGFRDHWLTIGDDAFEDDGGPPTHWRPITDEWPKEYQKP